MILRKMTVERFTNRCIDLSTFLLSSILTMSFPASFDSQKPTAITTIKTISFGNAAANFSGKFAKLHCLSSLKNEFIVFLRVILLFDSLFGSSGHRSLRILHIPIPAKHIHTQIILSVCRNCKRRKDCRTGDSPENFVLDYAEKICNLFNKELNNSEAVRLNEPRELIAERTCEEPRHLRNILFF